MGKEVEFGNPKPPVARTEIDDWMESVDRGLFAAADTYYWRQWDEDHGLSTAHKDGVERMGRIEKRAQGVLIEAVIELDHPSDAGLGLSESEVTTS